MDSKKKYTKDDLTVGTSAVIRRENGIIIHSHLVEFGRPLTEAERHLFRSILSGFYHTVRFSQQFGGDMVAEPVVEFSDSQTARYTMQQRSLTGTWKELLFAILTTFSVEVAPIVRHDESRAFAPRQVTTPAG